jgi:hypothetical protein
MESENLCQGRIFNGSITRYSGHEPLLQAKLPVAAWTSKRTRRIGKHLPTRQDLSPRSWTKIVAGSAGGGDLLSSFLRTRFLQTQKVGQLGPFSPAEPKQEAKERYGTQPDNVDGNGAKQEPGE